MNNSQRIIKALLTHQIHIKSLYTYQIFLTRRPKNPQILKFSDEFRFSRDQEFRVQEKLFKALELTKPTRRVDLRKFILEQNSFGKSQLLCAFKKVSKVKNLSLVRNSRGWEKEICIEKSLKYFKDIQYFSYKLLGSNRKLSNKKGKDHDCEYPLKYLRYCPKLQKIFIGDGSRSYCFKKFSTRSSAKRKNHVVNNLLLRRTIRNSSTKFLKEIISTNIILKNSLRNDFYLIQDSSSLQEINLNFKDPFASEFSTLLQKIFEKGVLKKVKLNIPSIVLNLEEILKALQNCKLTSFSLKTLIKGNRALTSLCEFLKHMNRLESLKLDITNQTYFNNASKIFKEICEEINRLEKLQHLRLAFNAKNQILKKQRLPNFLSNIYPVFQKLKTLGLSCNQLDHFHAFPAIITALQNLSTSLRKLKIDIGLPSRSPESHEIASNFVKTLHNIQVLKLPCLCLNKKKSLNDLVEAVLCLKGLEVLIIGEVDQNIGAPAFLNTIETLLCKRGLRKFYCETTEALKGSIKIEIKKYQEQNYNMQNVIKANPCLEDVHLSHLPYEMYLTPEIQKWNIENTRLF